MTAQRKLLFSVFTVCMALILTEIVLLVSGFGFDGLATESNRWIENANRAMAGDGWFGNLRSIQQRYDSEHRPDWFLAFDPILLWKTRRPAIAFSINEQGFRGFPVPVPKPSDEFRIIVISDSVSWGYRVNFHQTYSHLLETKLNDHFHRSYRVINAGVPGYTSEQGKLYFEQYLKDFSPDLVIVSFGRNDHRFRPNEWQGLTDRQLIARRTRNYGYRKSLQSSRLFQLVNWIVFRMETTFFHPQGAGAGSPPEFNHHNLEMTLDNIYVRVSESEFRSNIIAMHDLSHKIGADFLLITTPVHPDTVGNYNAVLRDISRTVDISLVDMDQVFRHVNDFSGLLIDECHPTPEGHTLFADHLFNFLAVPG